MSDPKKRLLITAFDFFPQTGGVATYAWELAESLALDHYEVCVITRKSPSSWPPHSFKIHCIYLPRSGALASIVLAFSIAKVLWQWRPQLILSTLWMPGAVAALLARSLLMSKIPIFTIVHGMEIVEGQKNWRQRLRKSLGFLKSWTFSKVQGVYCVSEFSRNLVLKNTPSDPNKVQVIHNGVNPLLFKNSKNEIANKKTQYPVLFSVCRLVPHKGLDNTIKALPKFLEKFPEGHYYIAGSGPDKKRLEKIVSELNLKNAVTFLGKISNTDLPGYYARAHLFVLLSREDLPNVEGFGLVFLEAAACGTASLGGNSGGIPDAILDNQTGWLVDPLNTDQISDKFVDIFSNPEKLASVSRYAQQHTLQERTWKNVAVKIHNALEAQV